MNVPTEIWYKVFSFLTNRSQCKFSSLLNLYNLSAEELELMQPSSNDLLIESTKKGYTNLIKLLIKSGGVNVNTKDTLICGDTALHFASLYGRPKIIKLLLENGADPNIKNFWGLKPVGYAIRNDYQECIKAFVDYNK